MRKDAIRSRERILTAARELFAEAGLSTTLNDIAHHAGVGVGTVYRHFPDREQLIESLFEERIDDVEAILRSALDDPDPWRALTGYMESSIELHASSRGVQQALLGAAGGSERIAKARARLQPLDTELIRRAQEAGALRSDIQLQDLRILQLMLAPVIDLSTGVAPGLWRRYLALVLTALRTAPSPAEAPQVAPPSREQVDQIMVAFGRATPRRPPPATVPRPPATG
jgi:AcrR family transcriptional regulator